VTGASGKVHLLRIPRPYPRLTWELRTPAETVGYLEALDGETVWISHIGVSPQYRGTGYATRLLTTALEHTSEKIVGLAAAPFPSWREPGLTHSDLRAWYARHGFRPAPLPDDPHRMIRPSPS
jgi:GNAT superfamily N-acetyltransferase